MSARVPMKARSARVAVLVLVGIAAFVLWRAIADGAGATYFGLTREPPDQANGRRMPANASKVSTPAPGQRRERRPPDFVQAAVSEIQLSPDVYATYAKYRSYADPSGEIAFRLYLVVDQCYHFVGKSVDQVSRETNPFARQSAPRRSLIERQIERCKGFQDSSSVGDAAREQWDRSTRSANLGAVASHLPSRIITDDTDKLDEVAIRILSMKVDDAVIKQVFNYLVPRNGDAWLSQYGDPAIMTAAWILLACSYGGPCDDRSPHVFYACIYNAACDRHDVESVLPVLYPSLTPERLQEAARVQSLLASYIQNRDWVRLGFHKLDSPPIVVR